jgi:hypothetical protein
VTLSDRFRCVAVCCVAALVVVGCSKASPKYATVQGRVVHNGEPLKLLANEEITVGLSAADAVPGQGGIGANAPLKSDDGTFSVSGRDHKGIPPGKYHVSLSSQVGYGEAGDRFAKLFDGKKPPLIAEVGPEDGQVFVIDIGKWTVAKQ